MSLRKKHKSPCPFASAKKPSKRKKGLNSFDKDWADVLAATKWLRFLPEGDSHMEQTGLLVGNFEFNP